METEQHKPEHNCEVERKWNKVFNIFKTLDCSVFVFNPFYSDTPKLKLSLNFDLKSKTAQQK